MAVPAIGGGGPDRPTSRRERGKGQADCKRGGENGIRPEPGTAAESESPENRRGGACRALHHAPHRERRMVDGNPEQGGGRTLPGIQPGRVFAASRVADPVCRFRSLAEELAPGRSARESPRLLETTT